MLKRLIIAVFGISLVLAFGSSVFAGPDAPGDPGTNNAPDQFIPNHPKLDALQDARPVQPAFKKPVSARRPLPNGTPAPAPPALIYFCDLQTYAGGPAYFWTIPDAFGDDLFNTRFTVEANFECTLKAAHILMYEPPTTGTPAMRVYLWADDGFGFPGAVLDSVDFSNAAILLAYAPPGNLTYLSADFSAAGWVFADGDEYHYGWTVLGGPGDTLANISDDGAGPASGEERSSEYSAGAWGSMLNDWGLDVVFDIISDRCCNEIPFSDCYTQSYWGGVSFFWRTPHPTFGDSAWAQRFDVGGPETLSSVDIAIYGAGGSLGDEDIYITVYDDDGSGYPGAPLAQVTLPGGTYSLFPSFENVPFAPLVVDNSFHVAFSSAGVPGVSWESTLSDNGTFGVGRSSGSGDPTWPGPGTWYSMLAWWGVDVNFLFDANLCRDEFSDCSVQNWTGGIVDDSRAIPDGNPALLWAQKFFNSPGGAECELRQVTLHFVRLAADITAGRDSMYTRNTDIQIKTDNAGYPNGALLHQVTLTPADYAAAGYTGAAFVGNFFITLNLNVAVPANFWVVVDPQALTRAFGIRHASNLFAGGGGNVDGMATLYGVDSMYYTVFEFFGTPDDGALNITAEVCCVPFSGRVCAPAGDDWSSRSHDLARSGASQLAIGDAWCDLNLGWFQDDLSAAATASSMGPVIYEGRAYQILETAASGSSIRVFNLASGALLGTISGAPLGNFAENDPLIVSDKLYISGGDNRVVSRWDVSGVAVPAVPDWTRTIAAAAGPLRRANLLLLDVAGTLVLFGGSQTGRAFAINESNGLDYVGWATNPITLDAGQLVQASATDGVRLYFGTFQGGLNGDVWAINPANGTVAWKLSTAGGYQAQTAYTPTVTSESFTNISVESDVLYVGGRLTGNFPVDGTFYRLDATNGAVLSVSGSNGAVFSNPIIDVNLVYLPTLTRWLPPNSNLPGDLFAYSKSTGALVWSNQDYYELSGGPSYFANALLTCEPEPDVDIIVGGNRHGGLHFWNSLNGTELFRRTVDFGPTVYPATFPSAIGGTAIGTDALGATHVLIGTLRGALIDLTKGADRPRLEIQDFDPTIAVEFSVLTSVLYTVPDIITNTGCVDLLFNAVNVDTLPFGSSDPYIAPFTPVRPGLLDAASMLADQMADNAAKFKNAQESELFEFSNNSELLASSEESQRNERNYRAALAIPAYLNGIVEPFAGQVVAPGDSIDLVLDIDPSNINRGPQVFYIELDTDDPDYFLNEASVALPNFAPELVITLVGGCLTDTTRLIFGVGSTDFQIVSNSVRLADSDWPETGWQYNGSPFTNTPVFQGTYIFGVSKERIAMNVKNWFGQPEANSWFAVQGDPNFCDNSCKPALFTGVGLGSIWNGSSYAPVVGNVVAKSWVDSVQDYGLGVLANWDWRNYGAPFSDSLTMGLSANTVTIGVPNSAPFDNFTVEIFEVANRNSTAADTIPGWKFGANIDYDASHFYHAAGKDTLIFDRSISASWSTSASNPAVQFAYGLVKLPFGCGYEPMVSTMGLDADQGHYEDVAGRGDPYFDSAYFYMSLAPGTERSHSIASAPQDEQSHSTLLWHNFQPSETIKFAVVNFGLQTGVSAPHANGGGGAIADLANFTNKWVGFGRGDVNDDNAVNLGDIMMLADIVGGTVPGAIPFEHLADVDADGDVDVADLDYLIDYYFDCGACPQGDWVLDVTCP